MSDGAMFMFLAVVYTVGVLIAYKLGYYMGMMDTERKWCERSGRKGQGA